MCLCFLWHVSLSWRLELLGVPVNVRMLLEMLKIGVVLVQPADQKFGAETRCFHRD